MAKLKQPRKKNRLKDVLKNNWQLYALLVLPLTWVIVFRYIPMTGVLMAFEDYSMRRGIFNSTWAGLKYFKQFFGAANFKALLSNTVILSVYQLLAGFPLPIILAIAVNECRAKRIKKLVQTVSFLPYFVSTVVMVSMLSQIFHINFGLLNKVLELLGKDGVNIMGTAESFRHMYVWSGVWQGTGYGAVLYIAALTSIDPSLKEAAIMDGASKFQRICHVDIPGILPTIVIQFILSVGSIMGIGFEKAYIMQTSANLSTSEIISTYVYKIGIQGVQFSYAAAIGVFNSIIGLVLVIAANAIAKKWGDTSLW